MNFKKRIIIITSVLCFVILLATLTWIFGFHIPKIEKEKETRRLIEEYYQNKLDLYNQENIEYDDYEVDVAFLGDSLTDGYDLKSYYPEYVVSNRGIGGETTFGLEDRLKVSVYDLKPKVVVILIGGNNLKNMFDNYENILTGVKGNLPDSEVVLLSLTAMGKDWKHKNEIACLNNVKIKMLANKYGCKYIDLFTPLFDINTGEIYSDYTIDGAHFTSKGYEVVTSVIKPVLDEILS